MKKLFLLGSLCLLVPGSFILPSLATAQTSPQSQTSGQMATPIPAPIPSPPTGQAISNPSIIPITKIDLLAAGTGDKKQLRFTPVVNSRQTSILTLKVNDRSSGAAIPATKLTMEIVVTQIDPNGDISFDFTYKNVDVVAEPGIPPAALEPIRSSLAALVGLSGSMVVDSRGQTKSTNLRLPQELDSSTQQIFEQLSSSLGQLYAPLPEEAVGLGARWRTSQELNINGIQLTQSAIYELVSNQNNVLQLKLLVEQEAQSQEVKLPPSPDIPAGFRVQLRSFSNQGEGEMTLQLGQMLPQRSILSSRSSVVLNFKPANNDQGVPVNQDLTVQIILDSQP